MKNLFATFLCFRNFFRKFMVANLVRITSKITYSFEIIFCQICSIDEMFKDVFFSVRNRATDQLELFSKLF